MLEQLTRATPPQSESVVDESISRKDLELAWLAGFIDGEGCMYVRFDRSKVNKSGKIIDSVVKVTNTNMDAIKKVSEIYKKNGIGFYFATNSKRFCSLEINVCGKGRIKKLINLILPYLVVKKEQALLMLEFFNRRDAIGYGCNTNGNIVFEDSELIGLHDRIKELKWLRHDPLKCKRQANEILGIPRDYMPSASEKK